MKQYFNEAATNWVNTDDISLDFQEKFHQVKRATIEKRVIEFCYFSGGEFLKYRVEPYELRIASDVWKVLIRRIQEMSFEEIFLPRMTDIEIKTQSFSRREIPDDFSKRYFSEATEYRFEIVELNEEIINRSPVENFEFSGNITILKVKTKSDTEAERVHNYLKGLCVLK